LATLHSQLIVPFSERNLLPELDRARYNLFSRHLSGCVSSTATGPFSSQIAALAGMAAMIDRPDRGIETGAAGAGRHRQGGADGKDERPLPYQSRPRCVLGLAYGPNVCGRKRRRW